VSCRLGRRIGRILKIGVGVEHAGGVQRQPRANAESDAPLCAIGAAALGGRGSVMTASVSELTKSFDRALHPLCRVPRTEETTVRNR
jgi:hypothetical protein